MTCPRISRALRRIAFFVMWTTRVNAQGVTSAAVQGTVVGADSAPVAEATVLVTNTATGERWRTLTRANGRFFLEHLSVGGPYQVEVRSVGYVPADRGDVFLSLGQRLTFDVRLVPAAVQLEEVVVRGEVDPRINAGRTGPAFSLADSTLIRLPTAGNRDFLGFAVLSPQVGISANGGFIFAGAHDRTNSLQVDGATNNDIKNQAGLSAQGGFGLNALPIEAIREIQVQTAPFDVRFGNFAGGLINAVSKSGSNQWQGSLFGYYSSDDLSSNGPPGTVIDPFSRKELVLTLGGPIVRDKVAFFLSATGSRETFPRFAPPPGSDTTGGADSVGTGIRYASLTRFQDILRNTYGVAPGTIDGTPVRIPNITGFAKVTAQLGINSRLEVSHQHLYAGYREGGPVFDGVVGLSSTGSYDPVHVNATRLNWTAGFGSRWTNELILARQASRRHCVPQANYPHLRVGADRGVVVAGAQPGCTGADSMQVIWEMTDNASFSAGSHHLTFGTHNELIHTRDDAGLASPGGGQPVWEFESLDDFEQGRAVRFQRSLPGPLLPPSGRREIRVNQLGLYAQDRWTPTDRLTLTGGLRVEVPFLPTSPTLNQELLDTFGINTSQTPSGHLLWSPRLGVNYDLGGTGRTYLRGGIGIFEGRPAYVWLEQAYLDTGTQEIFLDCFDDAVPAFTIDPLAQPTECGEAEPPTPVITVFDPEFRFPRNLKIALGLDRRLPWDVIGTVDLVHTRGVDQFRVRDVNLPPPSGASFGEGGRALYGTIDTASGFAEPRRVNDAFGPVVQITNSSGDRATSLAFQLQKRFAGGAGLMLSYTYTHARNRQDNPGNTSRGNLGNSPLDGTWENPRLGVSLYEQPHKLHLTATADLPLKIKAAVLYIGTSGDPFTYIVRGDANADGLDNGFGRDNDPVYVPRDAGDITLAEPGDFELLDQYIESEPCLRSQRGQLLRRNSCRNPWLNFVDLRLSKVVPTLKGQSLELTADLVNLLNFLDKDWGKVRYTREDFGFLPNGNRVSLLQLVGYDEANGRGIYEVLEPQRNETDVFATFWELHLGARYTF
jgi:hypothetical protein